MVTLANCFKTSHDIMQVSAAPTIFSVPMGSVFPPRHDAMGLGDALMEVMRGTVVSYPFSL